MSSSSAGRSQFRPKPSPDEKILSKGDAQKELKNLYKELTAVEDRKTVYSTDEGKAVRGYLEDQYKYQSSSTYREDKKGKDLEREHLTCDRYFQIQRGRLGSLVRKRKEKYPQLIDTVSSMVALEARSLDFLKHGILNPATAAFSKEEAQHFIRRFQQEEKLIDAAIQARLPSYQLGPWQLNIPFFLSFTVPSEIYPDEVYKEEKIYCKDIETLRSPLPPTLIEKFIFSCIQKELFAPVDRILSAVTDATDKVLLRVSEEYTSITKLIDATVTEYYSKYHAATNLMHLPVLISANFSLDLYDLTPFIHELPYSDQMCMMDYLIDQLYEATYFVRDEKDPLRKYVEKYPLMPYAALRATKILERASEELQSGYHVAERLTGFGLLVGGSALMILSLGVGCFYPAFFKNLFTVGYSLLSKGYSLPPKYSFERYCFHNFFKRKQLLGIVKENFGRIKTKIAEIKKSDHTFVTTYESQNPTYVLKK